MDYLGWSFGLIWSTAQQFLGYQLDFGSVQFSVWQFCIGFAVIGLGAWLISRILE